MASAIDATKPADSSPALTSDLRANLLTAKNEISALQTAVAAAGTVTSVSVTTANGVSGSVATATTTPAITLTLGAITPSSVASTGAISGTTGYFSGSTLNVNGTSATITFNAATLSRNGGTGAVTLAASNSGHVVKLNTGSTEILAGNTGGVSVPSGLKYAFSSTSASDGTFDASMARKAAKVIEFNNGTSGSYAGSAFGTGSQTVAQLTSAATAGAGARSFVTDATATTFLSTVAGGGANKVPVVSDGTNWLIG